VRMLDSTGRTSRLAAASRRTSRIWIWRGDGRCTRHAGRAHRDFAPRAALRRDDACWNARRTARSS
jgi:hypothetical protein